MTAASELPLLSIVIAVLNREQLVKRAISSVLRDNRGDYEIIVVDDGSTDRTAESVRSFRDSRVRLVSLPQNVGQCAARNRGAEAASGDWLVFLDSDDELVPGGLETVRVAVLNEKTNVGKILFSCRDDNGAVSPNPAPTGEVVNYDGYLRWQEETSRGASEALPCTRRTAFLSCPYPEVRTASEGVHELDFAKRWNVRLCGDIVRSYHYDAPNRLMAPTLSQVMEKAAGVAAQAEDVLTRHGAEMEFSAPTRWVTFAREAALYSLLAGKRRDGIRHSFAVLRRTPAHAAVWVVLVAGVVSPRLLSRLWSMKRAAA